MTSTSTNDNFWRGAHLPQGLQQQTMATSADQAAFEALQNYVRNQNLMQKAIGQMEAAFNKPRPQLWWEIEREQQRAAKERAIALRNDVRRICGQQSEE